MQKKPLILAALAALAAFGAQAADVKVYGIVDTGIHWTNSNSEKHTTVMDSGITRGSRFGFIGSEELGNGWKAIFNLENGFTVDDGALDNTKNRFFNRNAYLGVDGPYGELRFGRIGALGSGVNGSIFLNSFTVFGNLWKECQALQVINHQVQRIDNAIRYESPDLAGLKLYAEYSNGVDGDDAVASSKKDRFAAVGATYRSGPLRLVFVADNYLYAHSEKNPHFDRDDSQTYNFGARLKVSSDAELFFAYQYGHDVEKVGNQMTRKTNTDTETSKYNNHGFKSHAVVIGSEIDMFGGTLMLQTGYAKGKNDRSRSRWRTNHTFRDYESYRDEADVWQVAAGYSYPLSKRTYLYAAASFIDRTYKVDGEKEYASNRSDRVRAGMLGISHSF